jgi:hypothetical protein
MEKISIPALDDERVLRHVLIEGYRLLVWDTYKRMEPNHSRLGFAFYAPGASEPLFLAEDFGCSSCIAVDSDACLRSLMGFLTLKPGDTDAEYFENYTAAQLAFAQDAAEYLSVWADDSEPLAFENIEG